MSLGKGQLITSKQIADCMIGEALGGYISLEAGEGMFVWEGK